MMWVSVFEALTKDQLLHLVIHYTTRPQRIALIPQMRLAPLCVCLMSSRPLELAELL
jgi:hypothetical protein